MTVSYFCDSNWQAIPLLFLTTSGRSETTFLTHGETFSNVFIVCHKRNFLQNGQDKNKKMFEVIPDNGKEEFVL